MDLMGLFTGITQSITAYKTAVETLDEAKVAAAIIVRYGEVVLGVFSWGSLEGRGRAIRFVNK